MAVVKARVPLRRFELVTMFFFFTLVGAVCMSELNNHTTHRYLEFNDALL